jgi:outer membrane protein TolC
MLLFFGTLAWLLCSPPDSAAQDEVPHGPLSLSECVEISLGSSPTVLAAQERIEQARAAVEQAQSGFYPKLSIGETFTRSDFAPLVFSNKLAQGNLSGDFPLSPPMGFDPFDQFNDPGPLNNWNTQILVQWHLFQGGRTLYGSRAASSQLSAAESELRTVHNDLTFAVSAAYYEILKTLNSIEIAEESVRQIRSHLEMAEARYESEVALRSDVLRANVHLAEAEEALAIARYNLDRAKSRMNLAMGRPVNHSLMLAGDERSVSGRLSSDDTLDTLLEVARRHRPEIEGTDRNLAALENSVNAARAAYYPEIGVFAHYDWDTEDFSDSNDSWTIGVGANLSIFDGFLTRSAVRAARARVREAEARKEQLLLQVGMEVKSAYLAKSEAATRLGVLEQSVVEAEETLRIVSERYAEGVALMTELLDAEVALTNVRLRHLSAHYDYLVAVSALERAVGGNDGKGSGR